MILNAAFHLCAAASAIALELWINSPILWLQSCALYAFYLTIARGWLVSLCFAFIASALLHAHTGVIQLPSLLVMIFMAEWWRSLGDCSRLLKQIYPIFPSLCLSSLLSLLFNSQGPASPLAMILLISISVSCIIAPVLFVCWDFFADRCELPRYSVMDIYRGEEM